jgi:lysophospholipase L1-like esterase
MSFEIPRYRLHRAASLFSVIPLLACPLPMLSQVPDPGEYMEPLVEKIDGFQPGDPGIYIVFHGHSVPSGYYTGGRVQPFQAYPYMVWEKLSEQFPHAETHVVTTSIGGENAERGAERFTEDVLPQRPDVILIDYALNDRAIGLERAEAAWRDMIEAALAEDIKILLLTPTPDTREDPDDPTTPLARHSEQIRELAAEYNVGLVDVYAAFADRLAASPDLELAELMAQANHPNEAGHRIAAGTILPWFTRPSRNAAD